MSGILFFIFASCEPLKVSCSDLYHKKHPTFNRNLSCSFLGFHAVRFVTFDQCCTFLEKQVYMSPYHLSLNIPIIMVKLMVLWSCENIIQILYLSGFNKFYRIILTTETNLPEFCVLLT